jgi:hypothetical protein
MEKRSLPGSLVAVGVLFILSGISAALEMLHALANNWFYINFGVIGLFVGWGLLKLRPGWRIAALVLLVIGMIVTAIVAAIFLGMGFSGAGPLDFRAGGKLVGHVPAFLGVVVAVAVFALCYWQYRVLRRAEIRELFDVEVSPREARRMHRDQGRGQERGSHEA